ncbi:unnamed protein product [Cylindrotheca closterium]|uniref:Mannosyltransferase n=1 Tax=Cylindrotheca closterium TaxID=2856 RepID=A0AAD2FB79_9STRA|nr:unnamed protein product [Cylindrotheca closterium]
MITRSSISWFLYSVLVIARITIGPFLNGYVHPDELFQSGQEIWYGTPPIIAWEFEPKNALRSVLPPGIMTGIPLQIYGMMIKAMLNDGKHIEFSGREVLWIPRFACAIFSVLAVDWSIYAVVVSAMKSRNGDDSSISSSLSVSLLPLLLLASSWPTMVLLNRPFSNSMETCCVALLVASILPKKKQAISNRTCVYVGMLCALGIFTRFTFLFFAIPVMLLFLYDLLCGEKNKRNTIKSVMVTTIAFFIVSFVLILADTLFYSSDYFSNTDDDAWTSLLSTKDLVVTPWNALMYNSKVSNLKEHGLHPRWTHGLVNMFILFGPLTIVGYWNIIICIIIIASTFNPRKQQNQQFTNDNDSQQRKHRTNKLACWMIVSGLGFLSLAPHQEPRFLLPLLVPLVLLVTSTTSNAIWKERQWLQVLAATVWIVFNLVLFTLFGVLHQSGVVPSLIQLGQEVMSFQHQQPTTIVYYHTYMPPSFLLRQATGDDETCVLNTGQEQKAEGFCATTTTTTTSSLVDLNGSDWASLEQALDAHLGCKDESDTVVVLVMPTMIREPDGNASNDQSSWLFTPDECEMPGTSYDCQLLTSHGNHLSTEDLPPFGESLTQFYHNMALNVYQVSCSGSSS